MVKNRQVCPRARLVTLNSALCTLHLALYTRSVSNLDPRDSAEAALRGGRRIFDRAYSQADSILDRGQGRVFRLLWFFLPDTSVAKDLRFQAVFASRFLSDAGQQALAYGALIAVVRDGGTAFDAVLVGLGAAAAGDAGLTGAVADALPKRQPSQAFTTCKLLFSWRPACWGQTWLP
jgi:hypothetical protein